MANRNIFAKHIKSNVSLTTSYDAEGREIQVEKREDIEAIVKEQQIFDMLIKAGYYRACIQGLSSFDKIVGGMTWCIECCDYDVDVDLLFHENLTIGQKIALVEKIVAVLPLMKCPYRIEPHQIQGLEFLSIHPVIEWLVETSVENRAERNLHLKKFAMIQFHNNYQYKSEQEDLQRIQNAVKQLKQIEDTYSTVRQYQCQNIRSNDDERSRVQLTLLEYGGSSTANHFRSAETDESEQQQSQQTPTGKIPLDIDKLLENLTLVDKQIDNYELQQDDFECDERQKYYQELKQEMEMDASYLTEQSQLDNMIMAKAALEKTVKRNETKLEETTTVLHKLQQELDAEKSKQIDMKNQIENFKQIESQVDVELLQKVQNLLKEHETLKAEESDFKEKCRNNLAALQKQIQELEESNAEQQSDDYKTLLANETERLRDLSLQMGQLNRTIMGIERKLDDIPDRFELAQYQRRFHDLYNETSARHFETKQYYAQYNALSDKKRYMEKELSLLNSICDTFNEGMMSTHGRNEFIKQFEIIVNGVKQTENKVRSLQKEESKRCDLLQSELMTLLEQQRQYAAAVKQLTKECQLCEQLQKHLKSLSQT